MPKTNKRDLSAAQLSKAMRLNMLSGCFGTVWAIVCTPQPIFNVFVRNQLGASSSTLGALVGLLQLSGLFQLASIFIYGYAPRRKPIFVAGHLIHRLFTIFIAAAAFVAAAGGDRSWGTRAILIVMPLSWSFANATSSGWWSWVADIFPEKIRGSFFLKRSSLINVVNVVWFFLASMFLDFFQGPAVFWVYGTIFTIGAVSGLVDITLNLFIPEPSIADRARFEPVDAFEPLKNANFIHFSLSAGIVIFSINFVAPFLAPFVVDPDRVGAPNTWLGIMFVISQLTWVLVAPFWGTVMDKWGRKPVVVLGCMFTLSWIGYFFLGPRTFTFLLPLISISGGLLAPAFWEGINQMMLSLTPDKNRIAFVAWFMTILGVVSAGGSLAGGAILDALADFSFRAGPFTFVNLHVVLLMSLLMVILSAWIISRVREGRERPIGFVVGRIANPSIFRTYAYLDDLATSSDPGRAEQALRSIEAETGDLALDEISARLDDPYPEIREEAARALGRIGSGTVVEKLVARLADDHTALRVVAARALGKIRDARAVAPLVAALRSAEAEEFQEACVQALGDIGGDEAEREILETYRNSDSDRIRAAASDAASRLGIFEAAREILPRFLAGDTPTLRRQYAIALGNLLGAPGDFYPYVSGSDAGKAERTRKLFSRMEANLAAAGRKRPGTQGRKLTRAERDLNGERCREILNLLEEDRSTEALDAALEYSEHLLESIFGEAATEAGFIDFAFRLDPRLGAFAWLLAEVRKAAPIPASEGEDVCDLLVLLIAFFLAAF